MGTLVNPDSPVQPTILVETDCYFDPSSVLFDYEPGDDLAAYGGTFSRSTIAMYSDGGGNAATAQPGAARDAHYIGGVRTLLLEAASTNNLTFASDFSNAAWVKTTTTIATGIADPAGGTTACTLTATGASSHCIQTLSAGASLVRTNSVWLRRRTGTGSVFLRDSLNTGFVDVGSLLTSAWQRFAITSAAGTARILDIQIATSGNAVDAWIGQNEDKPFMTSSIQTTTVAVTRAADSLTFPFTPIPQAMTVVADLVNLGTQQISAGWFEIGTNGTDPTFGAFCGSTATAALYANASHTQVTSGGVAGPAYGQAATVRATLSSAGVVQASVAIAGGAEASDTVSGALALGGAFGPQTLRLGAMSGPGAGFAAFKRIAISISNKTLDTMPGKRTLAWSVATHVGTASDTPPNVTYRGRLTNPGVYTYDLIASWSKGLAQFGIGSVELGNTDGALDDLRRYVFDGYQVRHYVGQFASSGALSRTLIFQGIQEQPDIALDKMTLPIRSLTYGLDKPILSKRFLGTGGIEGGSTLAGTIRPRVYGIVQNIPLIPVDQPNLVYFVADRSMQMTNVCDEGLALTLDVTALTTVASLYSAVAPSSGHWIFSRSETEGTYVRLGSLPAGQLAGDCYYDGGFPAYGIGPETLSPEEALANLSRDATAVNAFTSGFIGFLYSLTSPNVFFGMYVADETTTYGDAFALVAEAAGWWIWFHAPFAAGSNWIVQNLPSTDTTTALVSIGDGDILDIIKLGNPKNPGEGVPPQSVTFNYAKNYTVQTDGLAATVSLDRRNFLSRDQRSVVHSSGAVVKRYPLSQAITVTGNMQDKPSGGTVQAMADQYFAALTLARDWYQIRCKAPASFFKGIFDGTADTWVPAVMPGYFQCAIGVRTSRMGFTTAGKGTNFVPMSSSLDLATGEMTMVGWTTYRSA